jgi:aminoglycoside phosphotransferase (APT) family kinase protein
MSKRSHTPARSSRTQHRPAASQSLDGLLGELDITPPGATTYELVSKWAAKHVWRVDANGAPWAYIRYLLGSAERFPERWRHMQFGEIYNAIHVGPRVLGLTPESEALGGRAAIVEAALAPLTQAELEARADEAIMLLSRLHSSKELRKALVADITDDDRARFSPLISLFEEVQERWFEAVRARWERTGLDAINETLWVVSQLMDRLRTRQLHSEAIGIVVPAHNDPNHGNFKQNGQGTMRMIDFETLGLNNPVADLGIFLTWYVDRDRHVELLRSYPLADPQVILARMAIWVPLRYLTIAAHWAARLTRARTEEDWLFAIGSIEEWLRSAAELVFDGVVPDHIERLLGRIPASLEDNFLLSLSQL